MSRFTCFLYAALLVSPGTMVARADVKDVEALLHGKWEMVSDPGKAVRSNLEFTKDGGLVLTYAKDFTLKGKFRMLDVKTIEVELPKGNNPKEVEVSKATIEVTKEGADDHSFGWEESDKISPGQVVAMDSRATNAVLTALRPNVNRRELANGWRVSCCQLKRSGLVRFGRLTRMPRWRKRLVIVAAVTVVLAASGFAYFRHLYPYGRSHCCDKQLMFALLSYADRHGGWFPKGVERPRLRSACSTAMIPNRSTQTSCAARRSPRKQCRRD